jgi:hypothetical protein
MEPDFNDLIVFDVDAEDELLEDFAVRVLVSGDTVLPFEGTLRARFDDEPVEAVARDMHGTGFTGYLKNEPAEGTKLFVTLGGQDEFDTGLTYGRGTGPDA